MPSDGPNAFLLPEDDASKKKRARKMRQADAAAGIEDAAAMVRGTQLLVISL